MIEQPKHILISRTDSIGDVVLTLPIAGILKSKFPNCKISFLGKTYTKSIIDCSIFVDQFLNWDELSALEESKSVEFLKKQLIDSVIHVFPSKEIGRLCKKAKIKNRIGTSHRLHHWRTCNIRPNFTRKKSDWHEAQLNVKLLTPFGINHKYDFDELTRYAGFDTIPSFPEEKVKNWHQYSNHIVLHPKSQGSAVEWGMNHFSELIELGKDVPDAHFYITGTEKEAVDIRPFLPQTQNFTDLTGQLSLTELIGLIGQCQSLVACSTGPLHIAGILNKQAIGLYSPKKPIHPGRWKPLGLRSKVLVNNPDCEVCKSKSPCNCIQKISATRVAQIALHSN